MQSNTNFLSAVLVVLALVTGGIASADDLILDINGTESNATMTASVVGSAVFQSQSDRLVFYVGPNSFDVDIHVEGALGDINPWL